MSPTTENNAGKYKLTIENARSIAIGEYDFLEITLIGSDSFAAAPDRGRVQYERAAGRDLFARDLFARLVDVTACRAHKIYPME